MSAGNTVLITVPMADEAYTITNAEGESLVCNVSGKYYGSMELLDKQAFTTGDDSSLWMLTVEYSDSFTVYKADGDIDFVFYTENGCVGLRSDELSEATFIPNDSIVINNAGSNGYTFEAYLSNGMVEADNAKIVTIAAEAYGDSVISIEDGEVSAEADKIEAKELTLIDGVEESELVDLDSDEGSIVVRTDGSDEPVELPFEDVKPGDWYYDAVEFVFDAGLMNGVGDGRFAPNEETSRAMVVTILWRMEGSPETEGLDFSDVPDGQWYSKAVAWASETGIVTGYGDGRFGSNDYVTREQLAAMLYRYEKYKGGNMEHETELSFADTGKVHDWAYDACAWCCENGIITGKPGNMLDPLGTATRAELATMLYRYISE